MISFSYVNGTKPYVPVADPFLSLEREMIESSDSIDNMISEFYVNRRKIMLESFDDSEIYTEKEDSNLFEKIGNAVIKMVNTVVEFITKSINKLKDTRLDSKLMKKVDMAFKNASPSEKQKIEKDLKDALKNGTITMSDLTNVSNINKAYKELCDAIKDANTDPKSLKGKVKKLDKMLKESESSAVVKGAKAVTAIGGAAAVGYIFKKHVLDSKASATKAREAAVANADAFGDALRTLNRMDTNNNDPFVDNERNHIVQTMKNAQYYMNGQYSKMVAINDQTTNGILGTLSNIPVIGGIANRRLDNMERKANRGMTISEYKEQIRNEELENAERIKASVQRRRTDNNNS